MQDQFAYRNGLFTELYQVTGRLKNGEALEPQIINARGRRDAMRLALQDIRDLAQVADIDAEPVN